MDLDDRKKRYQGTSTPQFHAKPEDLEQYLVVWKNVDDSVVPWELLDPEPYSFKEAERLVALNKGSYPKNYYGVVSLVPLRGTIK